MIIDIDNRYRTLMILWFILLMNLGVLFVVTLFLGPQRPETNSEDSIVPIVFAAVAVFCVIASFAIKRRLLALSIEKQDIRLVQQALIISFALCEASALIGLVQHFTFGGRYYYVLFALAALGFVFHFPKREQLVAASPKIPIDGATS